MLRLYRLWSRTSTSASRKELHPIENAIRCIPWRAHPRYLGRVLRAAARVRRSRRLKQLRRPAETAGPAAPSGPAPAPDASGCGSTSGASLSAQPGTSAQPGAANAPAPAASPDAVAPQPRTEAAGAVDASATPKAGEGAVAYAPAAEAVAEDLTDEATKISIYSFADFTFSTLLGDKKTSGASTGVGPNPKLLRRQPERLPRLESGQKFRSLIEVRFTCLPDGGDHVRSGDVPEHPCQRRLSRLHRLFQDEEGECG